MAAGEVAIDRVSICAGCAKHPELKTLVESDLCDGVCGVCGRDDVQVFNPASFGQARNLIRALIRLYFDEEAYNPHWAARQSVLSSWTRRTRSSRR